MGAANKICDLVDHSVAKAIKESSTMGELLDAIGLHIVAKERTDE
jgi:phosphatidylserine synthase